MAQSCVICKGQVVYSDVMEEFEDTFDGVDFYGVESLTEDEQAVYHGFVCSYACYESLS